MSVFISGKNIQPLNNFSPHFSLSVLLLDEKNTEGGNKFYKLKYNLQSAIDKGYDHIVTMGGPWSNHIAATAVACNRPGLKCTGIIRGEMPAEKSITLKRAEQLGMHLLFVSREHYRLYRDPGKMRADFPDAWCIPEGGSNKEGVQGCTEILAGVSSFDNVVLAVGTGATLAGIAASLEENEKVTGISVINNGRYLEEEVKQWLQPYAIRGSFEILHDFHEGGYAKVSAGLAAFVKQFNAEHSFMIEPVYTGKVLYALQQDHLQEKLKGKNVLMIHTGGLQYLL
jgi:1-aminocyclopropane-1-carboxylate deaminase